MLSLPSGQGVLPSQHLLRAIEAGVIDAGNFKIPTSNVQPASLDLRLGEVAYRIRCSFLSARQTVERKMKDYIIDELDLHKEGAVLETTRPYLIPLKERLALPDGMRGKANPKSSTGRLEDLSLNQLRLSVGSPELTDDELRAAHRARPVLYSEGEPADEAELALANGIFLTLDLRGDTSGRVGYRARDNVPLLDMTRDQPVDPEPYWEPVQREGGEWIVLTPQKFYLLMSNEGVSISPEFAAEMTAYDPTHGELRTHYAGFFDPGFGYDAEGTHRGTRAALEVRAHEVPFMIEQGQRVCKLTFERMLEVPRGLYGQSIGSAYQQQQEALGRHFRLPARSPGGRPQPR